jgi:hypothetical protein
MTIEGQTGDLPEYNGARGGETAAKGQSVRVHIDREPYETVTLTTAALYALAEIGPKFELFREASGEDEDECMRGGPTSGSLPKTVAQRGGRDRRYMLCDGRSVPIGAIL